MIRNNAGKKQTIELGLLIFLLSYEKPAMARHHPRRSRVKTGGKKIVYITPHRNLAVEMKRMYEKKGEFAEIDSETDRGGTTLFMVYIFEKGY